MTERQLLIRKLMLTALVQAQPYVVAEDILYTQLNFSLRPKTTFAEMESQLALMEREHLLTRMPGQTGTILRITDEGKFAANE